MKPFGPAIISSLLLMSPADAAKPAPPSGSSNPEISYIKVSGGTRRLYEFKLANEDGTGAATIFSSRDVGNMNVHLGPREDRTFALVQGGKISLGRYEITSSGPRMTSLSEVVNMNHVGAATVDMSRTGTDLVYVRNQTSQIWRYNIVGGTSAMLVDADNLIGGVAVSRDGSKVYYVEEVGPQNFALMSVAMTGGTPTDLGVRGYYTDVDAANTRDELILTDITDWPVPRLYTYDLGSGSITHLENGYSPSYKCNDSRIVYQLGNGDGTISLLYKDLPSGQASTLSRKDLIQPDYMPTC